MWIMNYLSSRIESHDDCSKDATRSLHFGQVFRINAQSFVALPPVSHLQKAVSIYHLFIYPPSIKFDFSQIQKLIRSQHIDVQSNISNLSLTEYSCQHSFQLLFYFERLMSRRIRFRSSVDCVFTKIVKNHLKLIWKLYYKITFHIIVWSVGHSRLVAPMLSFTVLSAIYSVLKWIGELHFNLFSEVTERSLIRSSERNWQPRTISWTLTDKLRYVVPLGTMFLCFECNYTIDVHEDSIVISSSHFNF
jgi:hypothetical protein